MIGKTINGYHIIREIKRGGMAAVYKGENKGALIKTKAFKVVRPDRAENNPALYRRFLKEIDILSRLSENPNIVRAENVYNYQNTTVLEMEYLDGMDFDDYVKSHAPKGINNKSQLSEICKRILEALDYAHRKNILHLDIKPSNIFRTQSGFIKLLDFGIAKVVGEEAEKIQGAENVTHKTETGESTFKGTLAYSSPEQQEGTVTLGVTSDIFSFGKTLHYIATGSTDMDIDVTIEPFATIVKKCTEMKRKDRFQSCQEIIDLINKPDSNPEPNPNPKTKCCNPSCGKSIDANVLFCSYCGTKQEKINVVNSVNSVLKKCPNCGSENQANGRYCTSCRHDFQQQSPIQPPPTRKKCPQCNRIYTSADNYCNNCFPITKLINY